MDCGISSADHGPTNAENTELGPTRIPVALTSILIAPTRIPVAPTSILIAPTRITIAPTRITIAPTRIFDQCVIACSNTLMPNAYPRGPNV
jgi:hypothetical protein